MSDPNKYGTWQERILVDKTMGKHLFTVTNQEAMSKLPPEDFYDKMHWLLHIYGMQFNSTRLAVIDWLKQEVRDGE